MSRLPSPHGPALPLRLPGWRSDLLRLAKVIWPFLLTMPLLVGIAVESFGLLTAGRAFVTGESLWSKAQKDAIQALARYSLTCDRHALADYEHAIAGPMGYRVARLELLERDPDLARARAGFIQGGSDPEDVDGMIQVFRRASDLPLMREAIRLWGEGDALLAELDAQAQNLALRRAGRCDDLEGHREAATFDRNAAMDCGMHLIDQPEQRPAPEQRRGVMPRGRLRVQRDESPAHVAGRGELELCVCAQSQTSAVPHGCRRHALSCRAGLDPFGASGQRGQHRKCFQ